MKIYQRTLHIAFIVSLTLLIAAAANAQTTAFNYQGSLTDGGNPANGSFQMQFKLFDALAGGSQIGSTLNDVAVTVTAGTFTARLDFGSTPFSGANRWLELAVRRNSGESYVTLSPREQITSSPYAIKTLSATMADDSLKLGGVAASEYVTNASAGTSFIRNQVAQQAASNFNISSNGIVGGNLGVGTNASGAKFSVSSPTASAGNNTAFFEALAIGPNGSNIHFGTTGDWYIRSANAAGKVILQDTGGNVGIGPGAPTTKLSVNSTFYGISHTDGSVNLSTFLNSSGGWLGTRSNHPLHFFTNDGAQRMTLNQAGQVGIGTTAPLAGYLLDTAGPVRSFGNSTHFVAQTTGGTNSWARFYMRSNNRSWFIGTSQAFNGDQFYLVDETAAGGAGQIRMSIQPNLGPIAFQGNIAQDRISYGLPKAIVHVGENGAVIACYNGITGVSGCGGMSASRLGFGTYRVDVGFPMAGTFVLITPRRNSIGAYLWATHAATAGTTFDVVLIASNASLTDGPFTAVVF